MEQAYSSWLARWVPRPLAVLGLLATAGATQAQTPTLATPVATPTSGVAPYGPAQQPALGADPTLPGNTKPNLAPARLAARGTARPAATQRLATNWTTMAAMAQVRAEPGATAHPNGKIYVWGGYGAGGFQDVLASAEAYTPATNTWAPIASLPMALVGPATAVSTDGSLYSFGGRNDNNSNSYVSNSYRYNVATNTWASIAPLPVARWKAQALTAPDGRIVVFGGWNFYISPIVGTEVQIYTPATNTWSTGAPMPVGLVGSAAGVDAAGLMHVYGGITDATNGTYPPTTAHLVYNVATNSWATAPATPTPARAYTTGLAGPDGSLYLCGGDDTIVIGTAGTYYSQVDSYNPTTATWSSEPALPVALTEAASAANGGNLYVVGGFNGTAQSTLYRVAVVATPALATISPTPATVGTSVTLTGSNLTGATAVTFAGTSNNTVTTGLTVSGTGSSQTITVAVPTGATTGPVTVTTPSGTSNGVAFTVLTATTPIVATATPSSLTTTSAVLGGNATADGGASIRERGVVYSVSSSNAAPTIGGTGVTTNSNGSGTGSFSETIMGLLPGTTYTVRAYATNSVGTSYGTAVRFTTVTPTITLASSTLPDGTVGTAYSQTLTASGGTAPYSFAIAAGSALPAGLTLSPVGVLSGTPTASGTVTFTARATDSSTGSGPYSGTRAYSLTIAAQPVTVAPVLTTPANNSTTGSQTTFAGTAPSGSAVTIYATNTNTTGTTSVGTTTATNGSFSLSLTLASGSYYAYATAQLSGQQASSSNFSQFTVDTTPPTATLTTSASNPTSGSVIPFTITFSEPVSGFSASGLTITNGTIASVSSAGNAYTFNVQATAQGVVSVSVLANAAQDAAGNGNLAAGPLSVTYSRPVSVAPVLLNPTNGSTLKSPVIIGGSAPTGSFVGITVTDLSNGATSSRSTSATNTNFSSQFSLPGGTYQAVATAQQGSNQPADSAPITFTVDATPPTATISTTAGSPTSTSPIPFTVSFSERVINFTAFSVNVTNGTLTTAITNVGNDYSFGITPTTNGPVTVSILANSVLDAVGNYNATTSSLSVTYAAPITATSWTGAVSTDWFDAGNWTAGVPTATLNATINQVSSGRYPLVAAGTATARNLAINPGASLRMSDGTLDVRANLTNNSAFVATGGTVVLGTSASASVVGSGTTRFWSLRVENSGAQLATSAGATVQQVLTLNGGFSTNGNAFTLLSNATGTALVVNNGSNVVSGTTTVQRYIDPSLNSGLGYRHYSSPVSNSTVGDLATSGFTPVVNPAYNSASVPGSVRPYPTVFGYDDARLATASNNLSSFDKGYFSPAALSDPLAVGRGYSVNIGASEVVDFQGTLNNGDLTLNLTSTRPAYPDGGWQLLGNPYPAPLDYRQVATADRPGLENAIYVYSSTSQYGGVYRAYTNGIGNSVLPVGQGFFARVASGQSSATLTFHNDQRLTVPSGTAFQRSAADLRPLVQLALRPATSPNAADEFYAYAEAGATSAFDSQLDAAKLPNPSGFNLAGVAASGEPLAVDGRATFTATTVLPLTVGVPAAGTYALSVAALHNLPSGLDAYLADDFTGQTLPLSQGTSYSFGVSAAQAAASITGRFRLLFRPATALATTPRLSATDVAVYPNPTHERFTVVLPGLVQATTVQAELLNALGQVVRRQSAALPPSGTQLTLETADLATGVYTLRLQAGTTTLAKRIVVQ